MTLVHKLALIGIGAVAMAVVLTLVANPHSMPLAACHVPAVKRYSALSLAQKAKLARCNVHHARWAILWAKGHAGLYRDRGRAVVAAHRAIQVKARANLRAIEAALHPPFAYPWWWVPLGVCETGVNPPDPGYSDGLYEGWINFLNSTWLTYGGGRYAAHAYDATEYEQYLVTLAMHADVPWSQSNPACSVRLGL